MAKWNKRFMHNSKFVTQNDVPALAIGALMFCFSLFFNVLLILFFFLFFWIGLTTTDFWDECLLFWTFIKHKWNRAKYDLMDTVLSFMAIRCDGAFVIQTITSFCWSDLSSGKCVPFYIICAPLIRSNTVYEIKSHKKKKERKRTDTQREINLYSSKKSEKNTQAQICKYGIRTHIHFQPVSNEYRRENATIWSQQKSKNRHTDTHISGVISSFQSFRGFNSA